MTTIIVILSSASKRGIKTTLMRFAAHAVASGRALHRGRRCPRPWLQRSAIPSSPSMATSATPTGSVDSRPASNTSNCRWVAQAGGSPMTPSIDTRVDSMTFRMTAPLASWWVHRGHRCWAADRLVRSVTRGSVRPVMRPAASDCEHLYPQLRTDELLGEAARLAWGEVPGLPQPMDCVGKGLTQDAGLNLQFVAGLGVIAAGIAVDDPDALGAPGQSRPQSALH